MGSTATAKLRPTQTSALDPNRSRAEARRLHDVARAGLSGPSRPFPYAERISAAFGAHAPEGLRAHIGPAARAANKGLSAEGYVWKGRAAFARMPDLHTAAHEAAHMVHQAHGGVSARYGVGAVSDRSEAFADRVADAVVQGRSAEPLLAAPPSIGGTVSAPVLQMKAKITRNGGVDTDTPWEEIQTKLNFKSGFDLAKHISIAEPRFEPMIKAMGKNTKRATSMVAKITGKSTSKGRKPSALQTAYGTIGTFEELITRSDSLVNYDFNGGHLISDLILGKASDVAGNFAPQRRYLNSPIFRKIEQIAEGGLNYVGTGKKLSNPSHQITTTVSYPSATHTVQTADLVSTLKLSPSDFAGKTPSSIQLTTWVPNLWNTTLKAPTGYEFAAVSKLEPSDSAYAGFQQDESSVIKLLPDTTVYLDSNNWSMDTLSDKDPTSFSGLGRITKSAPLHTFTGTQSVPRAGLKLKNAKAPVISAPTPISLPIVPTNYTFDDIAMSNLSGLKIMAKAIRDQRGFPKPIKLNLTLKDLEDSLRVMKAVMSSLATLSGRGRRGVKRKKFKVTDLPKFESSITKNRKKNKKNMLALRNTHMILGRSIKPGTEFEIDI